MFAFQIISDIEVSIPWSEHGSKLSTAKEPSVKNKDSMHTAEEVSNTTKEGLIQSPREKTEEKTKEKERHSELTVDEGGDPGCTAGL